MMHIPTGVLVAILCAAPVLGAPVARAAVKETVKSPRPARSGDTAQLSGATSRVSAPVTARLSGMPERGLGTAAALPERRGKRASVRKGAGDPTAPSAGYADGGDANLVTGAVAGGGSDLCAGQVPISGEAVFNFDNTFATLDGPDHAACSSAQQSQIDRDVWFCWTAPLQACAGDFVATTCGSTVVDTKIAIYDGCSCPPRDANLLTCSDDNCGLQTHAPFTAVPGQQYLIRIGSFPGAPGGSGTFKMQCLAPQPCDEQPGACQSRALTDALNSNGLDFRAAEDFTPATDGQITNVCWWGTYLDADQQNCQGLLPDAFEVRYYSSAGGQPDGLIGSFSQSAGTLTVDGPADTALVIASTLPEFEFSATHAPVPVLAGECYWVEITNTMQGCSWFWEVAPAANERAFQDGRFAPIDGYQPDEAILDDLAFCVDVPLADAVACLPPPPLNDDCTAATALGTQGDVFFEIAGATLDGPAHAQCLSAGENQLDHDEWLCWTSPCTGEVFVRTCDLTDVDTRVAVYDGCTCPPTDADLLTCNDDLCGESQGFQSMVTFDAVAGSAYMIRLGTYPGSPGGAGYLSITCGPPDQPGCPGTGSCCGETTSPACADEACCEKVCACDPFCCEVLWDSGCATTGFFGTGCGAEGLCGCNAACGDPGAGSCCEGNLTPACSDQACCVAICGCDSFCCDVEWDDFCAGEGSDPGLGCGAALMCADLCAPTCPVGTPSWVAPDAGVVDARRPHPSQNVLPREGISTIVAGAPTGADPDCWTPCETAVDGADNLITGVVEAMGTYTITLTRPITKGAVTTITYTDQNGTSTTAEYTSHPANVNDDLFADHTDVSDLIDALRDPPKLTLPWGLFSEDIDHSGRFAPPDILETINLLNGAAAFDVWNGRSKPTAAPTCP